METSLEASCPSANKLSFIDASLPQVNHPERRTLLGNRAGKGILPTFYSRVALTIPDATENPGGLCHRPGPRCLLPAGLRSCGLLIWLPGHSGDFSLRSLTFLCSSFYGLGLAPLSNWSTFQCHRLGPQKDPTCLNGRQSTQVASSKLLKWPRLFPAYGLVHCPTWH